MEEEYRHQLARTEDQQQQLIHAAYCLGIQKCAEKVTDRFKLKCVDIQKGIGLTDSGLDKLRKVLGYQSREEAEEQARTKGIFLV